LDRGFGFSTPWRLYVLRFRYGRHLGSGDVHCVPYAGKNAFLFGRSPTGWPVSQDMAVGRNILDVWFDSITVSGTTDDAIGSVMNLSGDSLYVPFEAFLQGGDSGGPMFVDDAGSLKLVGINWFIDSATTPEGMRNLNGQAYIGNYDVEIQAFIDAHPIPEPSAIVLLASACVVFAFSARRRR